MKRRVLLALAVAVCACAAMGFAARPLELRADTLLVDSAAQIIDARGHVRITDGRIVVLAVRAIYHVRDRRVLLSGGVTVTSPDGTLRSRGATVLLSRTNTVETLDAQGDVVARSGARTLQADRLSYTPSTAVVTATGHVQITVPTGVATGRALAADLKRKTGTLTSARIRSKEGTVSGDRLDIDGSSRQAFFRGHVAAEFSGTKIIAENATAYEREKKITFRGKVRITRPGRILLADVVTFYYQENRMVAEGQTRILIQESP